ncbi:MAG: acetylornithine deacetylase [Pseudomonadota bacterium]
MSDYQTALRALERLVSFDTTSRLSNLDLIDWAEHALTEAGGVCRRIPDETGNKANLWARIGPEVPGGLVLSGHTDVVPVDGQPWVTDPFALTEREGRLFGRGTCDMKGFVALCLAFAPRFAAANLARPVHFAFSHDEEVGCQGAPAMIDEIMASGLAPSGVWVGEPTNWQVVSQHKGIAAFEVLVTGREAHSSLPDHGVSAIAEAVHMINALVSISQNAPVTDPEGFPAEPGRTTITIGEIQGGTAVNILARECRFVFDIRCVPGEAPSDVLAPFWACVNQRRTEIQRKAPEGDIVVRQISDAPPLAMSADNRAESLARAITGDNANRAVAYATEAGQFQRALCPAVICGPGSIEQAHQPNEYLEVRQLEQGIEVFHALVDRLAAEQ